MDSNGKIERQRFNLAATTIGRNGWLVAKRKGSRYPTAYTLPTTDPANPSSARLISPRQPPIPT